MALKSFVGHRVREAMLSISSFTEKKADRPTVVFFPCGTKAVGSSNLRAWTIDRELRSLGFNAFVTPPQLELVQRRRILRRLKPDILVLQKGRHKLNFPELYPGQRIVFDLDDADYLDPKQTEQVRKCCEQSVAVIAGSRTVAQWCRQFNANTHIIWTGTPIPNPRAALRPRDRPPVVTWAPSSATNMPHDQRFVIDTLVGLRKLTSFEFWLYGVKTEGEVAPMLSELRSNDVAVRCFAYMPYAKFLESLGGVAVGMHPASREQDYNSGKSFGKTLAYLSSEVAIVTQNVNDHPFFFRSGENSLLLESSEEWAQGIAGLLSDPEARARMVEQAFSDFERELSSRAAGKKVHALLTDVLNGVSRTPFDPQR